MRTLRVERAEPNPQAAILTSRGWVYPDGTFKAHYAPKPAKMVQERGLLARVFGR
jgi:hypothetical protein